MNVKELMAVLNTMPQDAKVELNICVGCATGLGKETISVEKTESFDNSKPVVKISAR